MVDSTLFKRKFLSVDQEMFAALSGDRNPIHMDATAARRSMIGAPVVHGIHLVLCALESFLGEATRSEPVGIARFAVRFPKPALVGETVRLRVAERKADSVRIHGNVGGDSVLDLTLWLGASVAPAPAPPPPLEPCDLASFDFGELASQAGAIPLGLDAGLARRLYPRVVETLGLWALAEILALTRIVGMRCPGRHSLFGQFDATFTEAVEGSGTHEMTYEVEEADPRFRHVVLSVAGRCLRGRLRAFHIPPPAQPSMTEVSHLVRSDEFAGSTALIVGGSRGIGETAAKIIAAGGGRPIVTFYRGGDDAERVAAEIRSQGGRCDLVALDVRRAGTVVRRLFRAVPAPRSLYYFATPHIFDPRRQLFDYAKLRQFMDYYVTSFGAVIEAATAARRGKLRVFCPSSVAVEENRRETAEYAMAKRAAEELCAYYNRNSPAVEILVARLPRIKTDQTVTVMDVPASDSLSVMLPLIRKLEDFDRGF